MRAVAGAADGSAGVVFDVYSYYQSLYVQSIISFNTIVYVNFHRWQYKQIVDFQQYCVISEKYYSLLNS